MMQPFDLVAFNAYERLLKMPDPPDLPRRGHVLTCDGEPNRRETMYPHLLRRWLQHHYLTVDGWR